MAKSVDMKLESQIAMYLEFVAAANTESTAEAYRSRLSRYVKFVDSRRVTKDLLRAWYNSMLDEGLAKRHVVLCRRTVRAMYNWLIENELAASNPVIPVKDCTPIRIVRPVITLEEHERIIVIADKDDDDIWPYAVRCGWDTGLRLSDVAGLRWECVLWDERGIRTVPRKTKRFGKVVEIPLPDSFLAFLAAEHLKQGRPATGLICEHMALAYNTNHTWLVHHFSRIATKAAVLKTFHCYRHAFVTRNLARGLSAEMISTMTGQTVEQVMEYAHLTLEQKRAAMGLEPTKLEYELRNSA